MEEGQAVDAGQVLGALRTEELELRKAELEGKLRGARAEAGRNESSGRAAEVRAALEQIRWYEAQIAVTDRRIQACALKSPVKGFVLSRRPKDLEGAPVEAGRTVLEVAEAGRWRIEIRVPQEQVPAVQDGLEAVFTTPALPGLGFEGKVVAVGATASPGAAEPLYAVSFEVADPDGRLRSGMKGQGRVHLGTRLVGVRVLGGLWRWLRWKAGF